MSDETLLLDRAAIEALLPRYAIEGPRYTSYPTVPVWSERYGPDDFRCELGRPDVAEDDPISVYVHVPFCRSLCHFCACNRVITRKPELPEAYLDTLTREVAAVREAMTTTRRTTQHHWGGGTPTHLTPEQVLRLFHVVNQAFPVAPGAEISIEVDPRVTHPEHLAALRECGFNRISMGVQDFEPAVQEAIHRVQSLEQTGELAERARAAGFESVNFDLIYGLPYQRVESFERTLAQVLALAPDRIALYSYAHVTWVARQQRGFERGDLPDPHTKLSLLLLALRRLVAAGYLFIGLDHFARPDDELAVALRERTLRRNFMGHTTQAGIDLVGFGPSAISELRGSYAQSQRDLEAWHAAVAERGVATMRGHVLSDDDRERRFVIGRLMCLGEMQAKGFRERFGHDLSQHFDIELAALDPALEDGLVERDPDGSLRVTPRGRLFVRNLAMPFDAYLAGQRGSGKRMFSQTV